MPNLGAYRMVPADSPDRANVGGSGGAYWWHSPEDTIDKGDAKILASDTQLYLSIVGRLCTAEKLPFAFAPVAKDFEKQLGDLNQAAGGRVDLGPALQAAQQFAVAAKALDEAAAHVHGAKADVLNRGLMNLSRILNPVLYTATSDTDQDPALQLPMLPALQGVRVVAHLDPQSNEYGFMQTRLVRERNRVVDALQRATEAAHELMATCA
jgi:hypothetical protein